MEEIHSQYLSRADVEDVTGLSFFAIRRLEKSHKFPQRVRSLAKVTIRPGKVRWKRDVVEQWVREDEEVVRVKLLKEIMKPGMLMEKDYGSIRFHSPPGFWFSGAHAMEFWPAKDRSSTRIWAALWKNREIFKLKQCPKPCQYCQRLDLTKFSKAQPWQYQFDRNDQRRYM